MLESRVKTACDRDTLGFESVIYLKEILDRIAIPPVDEIPDKKDVKADKLDSWTIPHTEITIAVVKKGPARGAIPVYKQYRRKFREILQ